MGCMKSKPAGGDGGGGEDGGHHDGGDHEAPPAQDEGDNENRVIACIFIVNSRY